MTAEREKTIKPEQIDALLGAVVGVLTVGGKLELTVTRNECVDGLKKELEKAESRSKPLAEALERIANGEGSPDIDATGDYQKGLFCGIEDRDCADRYDGALFGHAVGVEKTLQWAINEAKSALEAHRE